MKRTRTNSVVYLGQRQAKYARGTKGNPIVISRTSIPRALPMRRAIRQEVKGMDTPITEAAVTNVLTGNSDIYVLNLIQQGAGSWNRVGRTACLKSIRLRGVLECAIRHFSQVMSSNMMRMVLVWDKNPNSGSIPNFNTIFGNTYQDGTETVSLMSPLRYDNMGRFSVLMDKTYEAEAEAFGNTTGDTVTVTHQFDHFIKLGNRTTNFSGQSSPATIADISSGALYLVYRSLYDSASSTSWAIPNGQARLRYTD